MPMYNKAEIAGAASEYGFQRDTFEKVIRLKTVLEFMQQETVMKNNLTFAKIRRDLFPVLTRREARQHFDMDQYKEKAKGYLRTLMDLLPEEAEYMDRFIQGEYRPELLFPDGDIQNRLENHPMAIWKCKMNKG